MRYRNIKFHSAQCTLPVTRYDCLFPVTFSWGRLLLRHRLCKWIYQSCIWNIAILLQSNANSSRTITISDSMSNKCNSTINSFVKPPAIAPHWLVIKQLFVAINNQGLKSLENIKQQQQPKSKLVSRKREVPPAVRPQPVGMRDLKAGTDWAHDYWWYRWWC